MTRLIVSVTLAAPEAATMLHSTPTGGSGLLALFCNLSPEWHVEFRQWLAEDMFPARRAICFPACASYDRLASDPAPGAPHRYLTLYEAPSLGDLYGAPYQRLREHRDARDTAFHARFQDLDRATLTWVGPELAKAQTPAPSGHRLASAPGFSPILVVDRLIVAPGDLPAFNRWFVEHYLPACGHIQALDRVRRYLTMERVPDDGARHLLLHEFRDETALADAPWQSLRRDALGRLGTPVTSSGVAWRRIIHSAAA